MVRHHFLGWRASHWRHHLAGLLCLLPASYWFLQPWKQNRHSPPKRLLTFTGLHGKILQWTENWKGSGTSVPHLGLIKVNVLVFVCRERGTYSVCS
jgi:hypothetical protein